MTFQFLFLFQQTDGCSTTSSPTTPQHRILQIIESSGGRKSSLFGRATSYDPHASFSPIRVESAEPGSNLVRMRTNTLGNSDPSLSSSSVSSYFCTGIPVLG